MSNIVKLHGNPHERTQMLLPWYVNGTLDAAESAMVEAHLVECAECRTELEIEQGMCRQVGGLAMDVEQGWAAMRRRLEEAPPQAPVPVRTGGRVIPLLKRPVAVGWAIMGQLAAAALVLIAVTSLRQAPTEPAYHALGSADMAGAGNLVVLFRPDTSENDMRRLLDGTRARVVEGPLASGAWVLRVDDAQREAAVTRLRVSPRILLAEPIDRADKP